jgi:hypothetical protein
MGHIEIIRPAAPASAETDAGARPMRACAVLDRATEAGENWASLVKNNY